MWCTHTCMNSRSYLHIYIPSSGALCMSFPAFTWCSCANGVKYEYAAQEGCLAWRTTLILAIEVFWIQGPPLPRSQPYFFLREWCCSGSKTLYWGTAWGTELATIYCSFSLETRGTGGGGDHEIRMILFRSRGEGRSVFLSPLGTSWVVAEKGLHTHQDHGPSL